MAVTCTVACADGGTSTSRLPVSLPSSERARTMHTTGWRRVLAGDADRHLDGLIVDQPVAAQFALDVTAAESLEADERDHHTRRDNEQRQADRNAAAGASRQALAPVAGGGTLDHGWFGSPHDGSGRAGWEGKCGWIY